MTFRLSRNSRLELEIFQVSPACRSVATVGFGGHAGLNRFRFATTLHGKPLPFGTYQIRVHTASGTIVRVIPVVIVASPQPSRHVVALRLQANVCAVLGAFVRRGELATAVLSGGASRPSESQIVRNQNPSPPPSGKGHRSATPFSPTHFSKNVGNPLVIAFFALAALLLGLAALPQRALPDPTVTYLVARHRSDIAFAGGVVLAAALVALLLS